MANNNPIFVDEVDWVIQFKTEWFSQDDYIQYTSDEVLAILHSNHTSEIEYILKWLYRNKINCLLT